MLQTCFLEEPFKVESDPLARSRSKPSMYETSNQPAWPQAQPPVQLCREPIAIAYVHAVMADFVAVAAAYLEPHLALEHSYLGNI